MSNNCAKPNNLNFADYKTHVGDRLTKNARRDALSIYNKRYGFVKKSQWMLLLISNAICLAFVAFSCMLIN